MLQAIAKKRLLFEHFDRECFRGSKKTAYNNR